ncbi:hypothetical protein C8Q76DRAFT_697861 [Earliella scabrosa]|nr:hypothetical protein C8Q76DRAFT_697861 [Earliella scabrosa]
MLEWSPSCINSTCEHELRIRSGAATGTSRGRVVSARTHLRRLMIEPNKADHELPMWDPHVSTTRMNEEEEESRHTTSIHDHKTPTREDTTPDRRCMYDVAVATSLSYALRPRVVLNELRRAAHPLVGSYSRRLVQGRFVCTPTSRTVRIPSREHTLVLRLVRKANLHDPLLNPIRAANSARTICELGLRPLGHLARYRPNSMVSSRRVPLHLHTPTAEEYDDDLYSKVHTRPTVIQQTRPQETPYAPSTMLRVKRTFNEPTEPSALRPVVLIPTRTQSLHPPWPAPARSERPGEEREAHTAKLDTLAEAGRMERAVLVLGNGRGVSARGRRFRLGSAASNEAGPGEPALPTSARSLLDPRKSIACQTFELETLGNSELELAAHEVKVDGRLELQPPALPRSTHIVLSMIALMKPYTYEARQDGERCALASLSPSLTLLATATTREWRHHTVHPRCLQLSLPIARNSRPLAASSDGLHDVPPLRPVAIPAPGMLSPPLSLRRTSPCSRLWHVQVPQASTFAHLMAFFLHLDVQHKCSWTRTREPSRTRTASTVPFPGHRRWLAYLAVTAYSVRHRIRGYKLPVTSQGRAPLSMHATSARVLRSTQKLLRLSHTNERSSRPAQRVAGETHVPHSTALAQTSRKTEIARSCEPSMLSRSRNGRSNPSRRERGAARTARSKHGGSARLDSTRPDSTLVELAARGDSLTAAWTRVQVHVGWTCDRRHPPTMWLTSGMWGSGRTWTLPLYQPGIWGLGRGGFATAESTSIWRGAVAHEESTMPMQSIVVTCALDGQSGSHVGSADRDTQHVVVLHSSALARARSQRHSTTAMTGQRHLCPRAHSDRHCRVHPARRRRQRARGPVDSAHARDTLWLGILFGLATEPERAIFDSVWPSQSIALAQWSFAQWGGARMASWRRMPSLPDGRLGITCRQPSSECLPLPRRPMPAGQDGSRVQETGFESGMNGFRWMDFEYAAWVYVIAVADRRACVCDKGSSRVGKTQERDDSGPTLARIGTRSGPRDRRRRAMSTPASSIRVSRTRSRSSSDDSAQEPARSFGSVQNRWTSSDSTPWSDDGVASRSDGCEQRERRKSLACTRSTTHFATLLEAVEALPDQDGWRDACARNRTQEPAVAHHHLDTVYRTRRSRGFPLSQGRSSTSPLSASPGGGLYPISHAEGRRSTLELTDFSDGSLSWHRTPWHHGPAVIDQCGRGLKDGVPRPTNAQWVEGTMVGRNALAHHTRVDSDLRVVEAEKQNQLVAEEVNAPTGSDSGSLTEDTNGAGPTKAITMGVDLSEEVVNVASAALERCNMEKNIVAQIRTEFDKRHGRTGTSSSTGTFAPALLMCGEVQCSPQGMQPDISWGIVNAGQPVPSSTQGSRVAMMILPPV